MRILFFTHNSSLYGANRSMIELILKLKEDYGVECAVMYRGYREFQQQLSDIGIESYPYEYNFWIKQRSHEGEAWWRKLAIFNIARELFHRCRDFIKNAVNLSRIYRIVRNYQPDIIHCNSSVADCGAIVARRLAIPYVWHLREFGSEYNICFNRSDKFVSKVFAGAYRVLAVSEAVKKEYENEWGLDNIVTVYNGLNPGRITQPREQHKRIRFCCNGLISEGKNQMEVLKAIKQLKDDKADDFSVDFYGDTVNYEFFEKLKDYIYENEIGDIAVFHGYADNIRDKLDNYDVGIVPSRREAFGRVTIEYMLSSMPVIGTDSGGTPEIIQHGSTGLLYSSGDVSGLADCMKEYMEKPELIMKHGQAGYDRAKSHFSLDQTANKVYGIYQGVVKKYEENDAK